MPVLLIFLALVFWLACGIHTSANTVTRGADRIRSRLGGKPAPPEGEAPPAEGHPRAQCCMRDVQSLFALYQSGALTREEFEEAKRHLLARLKASA
jgi:hypothetical protein